MEIQNENFNNLSIEELNKIKNSIFNQINDYNTKIIKLKEIIMNIDQIIYQSCDHTWIKDSPCTPYERSEKYCIKCKLCKN
tara:strand:+ start:4003 stop:4245 length:243 start_codon:yes stop_codon:yes gene_type:complete